MTPRYGIQFHPCGQIYYFTSPDTPLSLGTPVVVDTGHGENLGSVISIVGAMPQALLGAGYEAAPDGSGAAEFGPTNFEGEAALEMGAQAAATPAAETEAFGACGGCAGACPGGETAAEVATGAAAADLPVYLAEPANLSGAAQTALAGEGGETGEGAEVEAPGNDFGGAAGGAGTAASRDLLDEGGHGGEHELQELSETLSAALNPDSPDLAAIRRIAGPRDLERAEQNIAFAVKAGKYCMQCAADHRLDMKLVHTEVSLDGGKLIFFFTAPGRIDFRELVKALARNFHARIELRQIGVRHETQLVGAIGNCGMVCCCRRYMRKFAPVTIKMAKEQGLFLNPVKISGTCGRLLCCLSFEQHNYEEFHGRCPKLGKKYETSRGVFKVLRASLFRNSLTLLPEMGDELEVTLEEWRDMQPARYDAARRQRAEREARAAAEADGALREPGAGQREPGAGQREPGAGQREPGAAAENSAALDGGAERQDDRDERGERGGRRRPEQPARGDLSPREGGRRRDARPGERSGERQSERERSGARPNARLGERRLEPQPEVRGGEAQALGYQPDAGADKNRLAQSGMPGAARDVADGAALNDAPAWAAGKGAFKDVPVAIAGDAPRDAPAEVGKDAARGLPRDMPVGKPKAGTGLSRFLAASAGDED